MAARLRLPPLPTVPQILKIYNVRAQKQLAQNFLFDPKIIQRIVSCVGTNLTGKQACEVGPGPGGITREILNKNVQSLSVVEKDHRFIRSLQMLTDAAEGRMKLHHADILTFNTMKAFSEEQAKPWTDTDLPNMFLIGNLPFNVSLPLLFKWLDDISHRRNVYEFGRVPAVLTFQQEVAERLVALPGEDQRCRLSITAQYLCDVRYCFSILGKSFVPAPNVDVAVVRLTPKQNFDMDLPFKTVDQVTKHVFHFRQKRCIQAIRTLFPPQRDDLVEEIMTKSNVDPDLRPFQLYMSHFRDLCYAYQEICTRYPKLAEVDTYGPKNWLKYFDESGEPLENSV